MYRAFATVTTIAKLAARKTNVSSKLFCNAQIFKQTKTIPKTKFINIFNKIILFIFISILYHSNHKSLIYNQSVIVKNISSPNDLQEIIDSLNIESDTVLIKPNWVGAYPGGYTDAIPHCIPHWVCHNLDTSGSL